MERKKGFSSLKVIAGLNNLSILAVELGLMGFTLLCLKNGPRAGSNVVSQFIFKAQLDLSGLLLSGTKNTQLSNKTLNVGSLSGIALCALSSDCDVWC